MTRAYVGLGANLGDRERTLRAAVTALAAEDGVEVVAVSTLRETEPVGVGEQPLYLNGAAELETTLTARELLDRLLAVEQRFGRVRVPGEHAPRTLDLDLLLYGDEVIDEPGAHRPAPAPARAALRPRAARRAGSGPRRAGRGDVESLLSGATLTRMSHLDDLDEYEAELELALKKEYQAVFGLFRFCVLTQDATYLCNKLDVQQAAPSAAGGLPFFQLELEDVWVWDKNRPTRIIPRAKVFTSGDVTVEELRGEGDEPQLTAEALAERIGEPFRGDDEI